MARVRGVLAVLVSPTGPAIGTAPILPAVRTLSWISAVIAALYALHRLALWMEGRGWLYYMHKRGSSGSLGSAFLEVHALMDPGKRHVLEVVRDEDDEQD